MALASAKQFDRKCLCSAQERDDEASGLTEEHEV